MAFVELRCMFFVLFRFLWLSCLKYISFLMFSLYPLRVQFSFLYTYNDELAFFLELECMHVLGIQKILMTNMLKMSRFSHILFVPYNSIVSFLTYMMMNCLCQNRMNIFSVIQKFLMSVMLKIYRFAHVLFVPSENTTFF